MAGAPPSVHFLSEDRDLDDAELWAAIDSAVASKSAARSRKPLLALKNSPCLAANQISPAPSPQPQKQLVRNPRSNYGPRDKPRAFPDGEVVQEEQWPDSRPQKMARIVESPSSEGKRMVVVRHPAPSPAVSFPSPYATPNAGNFFVQEITPIVETSPQVHAFGSGENDNMRHSLSGQFPSVSLFKQYQNSAMAILEKSDYTMISGNPFIKKSGWRKISFYFNISFEIKDKSIEFDENHNVQRAEFVVRAHMQSGRFSDGWGSCERREKKFMKPNHDIPSTAETRAKNRACQDLLGIGEYRPGANNNVR